MAEKKKNKNKVIKGILKVSGGTKERENLKEYKNYKGQRRKHLEKKKTNWSLL